MPQVMPVEVLDTCLNSRRLEPALGVEHTKHTAGWLLAIRHQAAKRCNHIRVHREIYRLAILRLVQKQFVAFKVHMWPFQAEELAPFPQSCSQSDNDCLLYT